MDERLQFVARRLAGEGMAELCREFGISCRFVLAVTCTLHRRLARYSAGFWGEENAGLNPEAARAFRRPVAAGHRTPRFCRWFPRDAPIGA
jgi:hypothetical protein